MAFNNVAASILAILSGFLIIRESVGTMCAVQHPQTAVCKADFVIKAKVIDTNFRPTDNKFSSLPAFFRPKYIKVELRKIYKGRAAINAKTYETVKIRYGSMGRVNLEVGHLYILTGYTISSTLFMNLCSWNSKMKDLSLAQKFGINRVYYWLYCRCQITHCKGPLCQQDRRTCFWDQGNPDCHSKNKICMVKGGAKCEWAGPNNSKC